MKHTLALSAAVLTALPVFALAEPLNIVTDIAPIESLVLQVAGPDAKVTALVADGASAHGFQLSFDQAGAVQDADVAIYVGPQLSPWLEEALETIAPETSVLALLNTEGWPSLTRRERAVFSVDEDHADHDDHEGHDHDEHDHEEHAEQDHADHDGHDGHAEEDHADHDDHASHAEEDHADHDDHAGHDHGQVGDLDPHAWTDPQVAIAWVDDIAAALSEADPENSSTYAANAEATIANLTSLDADIAAQLAGLPQTTLISPHDAYQYFGNRYGLPDSGSISVGDATAPAPDRIAALQTLIRENNITCVLSDPQSRSEWVELVRDGTDANTALADPLGAAYPRGADHYAATIRGLADAYATCLGGGE